MTGARRRFSLPVPDWGQDHLSTEAVVAYVDDELAAGPHDRATRHLASCGECAAHVNAQRRARSALRTAETPCLPSSLLSALRSIPQDAELPPPPAGLAVTADGQFVDVVRPERSSPPIPPTAPPRGQPSARRMVIGATAAVSGLALGALALGASASAAPTPAAATDRGVFNGSVLGSPPVEAGLRLPGAVRPPGSDHPIRSWLLGR
ncbi:MAG: zf-HC2 domain-containing protein [Pseudonocardia sp.]|nr:zf-HC2 domain-containing protein [Pseudonocardia sp.]